MAEEIEFYNNLENGTAKFYHPNGRLAISGEYNNGKMVDEWSFFTETGDLANGKWKWKFAALPEFIRMEGNLENGRPTGNWTYKTTAGKGTSEYKEYNHQIN